MLLDHLKERGLTIAFAESATGGRVSSLFTLVPGASKVLKGSVVVYSGFAKDLLGCGDVWRRYGTVSSEIAVCLARRVSELMGSDIGVGVVGTMGPGYDERHRRLGQVYYAVWLKNTPVREGSFFVDVVGRERRICITAYKILLLVDEVICHAFVRRSGCVG